MTNPIRVLHIVHSLGVGGMEGRIARLARGLHGSSCRVSILSIKRPAGRHISLPEGVVPEIFEVPPGIHPLHLWRLGRMVRAGGYHIVHTHNWGSMFYGVLAARLGGVPVVLHGEHGINFEDTMGIPWRRVAAQKVLAALSTRIITVNLAMTDSMTAAWRLPPGKAVPILNGVDLARFRPGPPASGEEIVIGSVGRLDKVKNFPCLLRAFALLTRDGRFPGARLALVGEGPMKGELERERDSLGIGARLELAGDTPSPEDWYARMGVFVNASYSEGMSNTILEAMAAGLPVVASDVDGNRSWLREEDNALFFRSDDPADLAEKLERLCSDHVSRRAMGERNRLRAEAEFDNRFFLQKYLELYRSLVSP